MIKNVQFRSAVTLWQHNAVGGWNAIKHASTIAATKLESREWRFTNRITAETITVPPENVTAELYEAKKPVEEQAKRAEHTVPKAKA